MTTLLLGAGTLAFLLGCQAPQDAGSREMLTGSFMGGNQTARVADLMARDMVRHPIFYTSEQPPRIAVVKIDNNTNQYLFSPARNAYVTQLRTQLKRALKDRVVLVDPQLENRIRSELVSWYPSDDQGVDTSDVHGADYLLTARFDSLNKVVSVADEDGKPRDKQIVELQMTFSLVDAESAELVWQNDVSSAAVFTTRDFQN